MGQPWKEASELHREEATSKEASTIVRAWSTFAEGSVLEEASAFAFGILCFGGGVYHIIVLPFLNFQLSNVHDVSALSNLFNYLKKFNFLNKAVWFDLRVDFNLLNQIEPHKKWFIVNRNQIKPHVFSFGSIRQSVRLSTLFWKPLMRAS